MCGISGEIRRRGDAASAAVTEQIAGSLKHRGPDAGGVYANRNVALGHRRLSILDLSPAADQPMIDAELGLAIAFNGCIYNFRELKQQLEAKGYRFFTDGDTEVILKSYHAWGPRCVTRFKGMFAFAISDAKAAASCSRATGSASSRSTIRTMAGVSALPRPYPRCSPPAMSIPVSIP